MTDTVLAGPILAESIGYEGLIFLVLLGIMRKFWRSLKSDKQTSNKLLCAALMLRLHYFKLLCAALMHSFHYCAISSDPSGLLRQTTVLLHIPSGMSWSVGGEAPRAWRDGKRRRVGSGAGGLERDNNGSSLWTICTVTRTTNVHLLLCSFSRNYCMQCPQVNKLEKVALDGSVECCAPPHPKT